MTAGSKEPQYLYLTTIGRHSGQPREIEIWFTQLDGKYYIISYLFEKAGWIKNVHQNPDVTFRVGTQDFHARARIVDSATEAELYSAIRRLSDAKYDWSDGLIVELIPD